jgi:hypothetical protein
MRVRQVAQDYEGPFHVVSLQLMSLVLCELLRDYCWTFSPCCLSVNCSKPWRMYGQHSHQESRTARSSASVSDLLEMENRQLKIRRSRELMSLSPCLPPFISSGSYLP